MTKDKVVLITGCSSGFGYLSALRFARENWVTVASIKSMDNGAKELQSIAKEEKLNLDVIKIDVTNESEVKQGVDYAVKKYKKVDVLVNNAGFGYLGTIEDFEIDEVRELYEVNIYGILRMIKSVLPHMRKRNSGRIINISSVNGLLSFGLYGIYSSSKFAIETISEALRFEVKPFNISVSVIEPGGFNTNFHQNKKLAESYQLGDSAYSGLKNPLDNDSKGGIKKHLIVKRVIDPQIVADKIYEVANVKTPKLRYKVGLDTKIYTFLKFPNQFGTGEFIKPTNGNNCCSQRVL